MLFFLSNVPDHDNGINAERGFGSARCEKGKKLVKSYFDSRGGTTRNVDVSQFFSVEHNPACFFSGNSGN
jgi:hypothetical protein